MVSKINAQAAAKVDAAVGLLANVPQSILTKLLLNKDIQDKIELTVLYRNDPSKVKEFVEGLGGEFQDLGLNFGILKITIDKVSDLANSPEIQYIELPKSLYFTDFKSSRASCVPETISTYKLSGKGVLVGFIDSGIDYTHPAFMNADGTTRIEYIYDLSSGDKIYTKEQINQAIKSDNPFSIVPEVDITGHGTHVAGDACGGGNIPSQYKGIAQEASIAMVKGARGRWVLSSQIMKGIKFLIDKSKELEMPLVINISLSTNDGAHNGTSLLEQYIQIVANIEKVTIVVAAGNEGDAAHHASGRLKGIKTKTINIASDEVQIVVNLYKPILPDVRLKIIGASGSSSDNLEIREGYFQGNVGRDRYDIYVSGPKPFQLNSEIQIVLSSISAEYIVGGEWKIQLDTINEYDGDFTMWLPISEGLNSTTKFLEADQFNTLGIPATVSNIIAVGSYNPVTNTLSTFSGKGENVKKCIVRPDIVAPGENIIGPVPDGTYDSKTGTSMATPQVTGICALFSEWGIVKGHDPYLFGQRLKYYLVKGATRKRVDIDYPNPLWGYGTVCAFESMKILENVINSILSERNKNHIYDKRVVDDTSTNNSADSNINASTNTNSSTNTDNSTNTNTSTNTSTSVPKSQDETNDYIQFLNKPNVNYLINQISTYSGSQNDELGIIVQYSTQDEIENMNKIPDVVAIEYSPAFAIVRLPIGKFKDIIPYIKEIEPLYNPELYTLTALSPVESSGAPIFNDNPYLQLDGTGVIVGIIDTGIDYLNEEFMLEDDTTRIVRILDQTIDNDKKKSYPRFGTEYTEEQINQAIELKKQGGDPYSIVPSKDENGHGTMTAGIIGGRGRNLDLRGAAPNCKFAVVKLKEVSNFVLNFGGIKENTKNVYGNIEIMLAINYLSQLAIDLKSPLVLYLPLGSNMGGHDGSSPVEGLFDFQINKVGIVPVVGTGNQGDTQTHIEGKFEENGKIQTIQIKVGSDEKDLNFEIYCSKPDKVEIEIVSPSGEVLSKVNIKIKKVTDYKFVYEGTRVSVIYLSPDSTTGDEVIIVRFNDIKEGTWQFRLYGERIVNGKYSAWLPQRELLDKNTRFFNPIQRTTLMVPATTENVIAAAYYNQEESTIVASSGKGYTRNNIIKPDIAVGGVGALVIKPGGGTTLATGSSVASAVLAGCCALLLQWSIVDENDTEINFRKIQSYIIGGAKMRKGDIYPNIEWGYGILDMQNIIDSFRTTKERLNLEEENKINYETFDKVVHERKGTEYANGKLFYRFP